MKTLHDGRLARQGPLEREAGENSGALAPKAKSHRNHLRITRSLLKALRNAELSESRLRTALIILEYSNCCSRDAAPFPEQKHLAELDGKMSEPQASRDIRWLLKRRIIERGDGLYWFNPPDFWDVKLRAKEGRQKRQLELELWFDKLACQEELNLYELNTELRQNFLAAASGRFAQQATALAQQASPPMCEERAPLAQQATALAQQATARALLKASDKTPRTLSKLRENSEVLKTALAHVQSGDERQAMKGMLQILGEECMEPSERNPLGDGGKWRTRWRKEPAKTRRVMAALVEQMTAPGGVNKPGGYAQDLWKRFA